MCAYMCEPLIGIQLGELVRGVGLRRQVWVGDPVTAIRQISSAAPIPAAPAWGSKLLLVRVPDHPGPLIRHDQSFALSALNARREIDRSLADAFQNLQQKFRNHDITLITRMVNAMRTLSDSRRAERGSGGAASSLIASSTAPQPRRRAGVVHAASDGDSAGGANPTRIRL
jgi:hypothetical protein